MKPDRVLARGFGAALLLIAVQSCTRAANDVPAELWREVSGDNAMRHVEALVAFGPRPPDTDAIEKSRRYITDQLQHFRWTVVRQEFSSDTPRGKKQFANLIATFGGEAARPRFLLCSHYDTKTFDSGAFVGANDGGSSTGLLVELARVFAKAPKLATQLELVFFDGEEAYRAFTETDGLYGSRYFAKQLAASDNAKQFRGGILFDMIGDRSLDVTLPPDSPARPIVDDELWWPSGQALRARRGDPQKRGSRGRLDEFELLELDGGRGVDHGARDSMSVLSLGRMVLFTGPGAQSR